MQKPIYSPRDEEELMAHLWSPQIADDPEAFVMFVYPWGVKDTPLERFTGPRAWQRARLREIRDKIRDNRTRDALGIGMDVLRASTVSGRGIGKSALVAWLVHWMLSTRIGSTVTVSANTEAQLRSITWGELSKWTTMLINSHWWEISATRLIPAAWLTALVEKDLKKGTRYWGAEGKLWSEENPDGYAGTHNMEGMMLIFDEASGIPDSIWSVAAGFFTEHILDRYWFAFSNGRRNEGYFYETHEGSKSSFWSTTSVDARTVEHSDKSFYAKIIEEYGPDSDEARVEVYGQFPAAGDSQFIARHTVRAAMDREAWNDPTAPLIMGIDPAGGGTDSTVIALRRGRDLAPIRRIKTMDTMEAIGWIVEAIQETSPSLIVIDETGLGYVFKDRLKEQGFAVRGVNFAWRSRRPMTWGNKRVEIWGDMRQWLREAHLPDDKRLLVDLTGPRKKANSRGIAFLEGKDEMRARGVMSPDSADALAVTFAFPVAYDLQPAVSQRIDKTHVPLYVDAGGVSSWMGA